jgi:hypothetical protein
VLLAVVTWGYAALALERVSEGVLGGVAGLLGDGAQRFAAVAEVACREGHPPPGQVGERGLADQGGESAGESRP